MIPSDPSVPSYPDSTNKPSWHSHFCRHISWGAILAGFSTTLALQVIFILLGASLGFAAYEPLTDSSPVATLGKGALVVHGVSAVLSLFAGGWVAGRFTPVAARINAWLHGFVVWTLALIAGVAAVTCGAGWTAGAVTHAAGKGLSAISKPVLAAAAGAGAVGAKEASSSGIGDTLKSFTDEALSKRAADAPKGSEIRAKRDIALAVGRLFNPANEARSEDNKAALVKTLADRLNISESDATALVKEWSDTYDSIRKDVKDAATKAEEKARKAADEAAGDLAIYALCTFIALLLGSIAASIGGCLGACCARRCEEKCCKEKCA